jgi:hypothetical protein
MAKKEPMRLEPARRPPFTPGRAVLEGCLRQVIQHWYPRFRPPAPPPPDTTPRFVPLSNPPTPIGRSRCHLLTGSGPQPLFQLQGGRRQFPQPFQHPRAWLGSTSFGSLVRKLGKLRQLIADCIPGRFGTDSDQYQDRSRDLVGHRQRFSWRRR